MKQPDKYDDVFDALCYMVTEVWKSGKSQRINLNDHMEFDYETTGDKWKFCNDPIRAISEAVECMDRVGDDNFGPEILVMKSYDVREKKDVITLVDMSHLKRSERKLWDDRVENNSYI
ncbi:MAG: hypothetical protein WC877_01845 [Dehalococcoidales bacterium]|jgi:hypothetical protein